MKILSNFTDFYDTCAIYCGEQVFERYYDSNDRFKYPETKLKLGYLYDIKGKYTKKVRDIDFSILIIGEKVIPFISTLIIVKSGLTYDYKIFMNSDELNPYFDKNLFSFYKSRITEHFESNYIDLYNAVRKVSNDPIVLLSYYNDDYDIPRVARMEGSVHINPNLKRLGFSKLLVSSEVIQEIDMFLGKLNTPKDVEFSNETKIVQNGFTKDSFKGK